MDQHREPNDIYEFLGHVESIIFPILALVQDINSLDKVINCGIVNGLHDSIKDKAVKKLTFVDRRVRLIVARLANTKSLSSYRKKVTISR